MSRIMIHSNAPWVPSGYGKQTMHLARILRKLGHEVAISSFCGLTGAPIEWEGCMVLPGGQYEYGVDVLIPNIEHVQPDLTIALMDVWKLGPLAEALTGHQMAAWVPVDCSPLSRLDNDFLNRSGVRPIAMSRFGEEQLRQAGHDPLYAPHVVDRSVFKPPTEEERAKWRAGMGVDDRFVIGICAANNDATRKAFPEQFAAFAHFHRKHPQALLWVHSIAQAARGLDLPRLAAEMGIPTEAIRFTDPYAQVSGVFDDTLLADWYGVLDVLSACSYAEAFGVPLIEAQACGTPAITTRGSAMTENGREGWYVAGDRFWNHVHGAWWDRPRIEAITRAYEKANVAPGPRRVRAAEFAEPFDVHAEPAELAWRAIVGEMCAS